MSTTHEMLTLWGSGSQCHKQLNAQSCEVAKVPNKQVFFRQENGARELYNTLSWSFYKALL